MSRNQLYQIVGWDKTFENNKSRERERCGFVAMPNSHDGMGIINVLSEPDGAAIYGVWCLMVQTCSRQKSPRHGYMTDSGLPDGRPWSAREMALRWHLMGTERALDGHLTGIDLIERAIRVLSDPNVGWIRRLDSVPVECPSGVSQVPAECPPSALERKEGKEREEHPPNPPQVLSGGGGGSGGGDPIMGSLVDAFDAINACPHDAPEPDFSGNVDAAMQELLDEWQGHARWGGTMLQSLGSLVNDYGRPVVMEGIKICIEDNVRKTSYLRAVCANGSKRLPSKRSSGVREDTEAQERLRILAANMAKCPRKLGSTS